MIQTVGVGSWLRVYSAGTAGNDNDLMALTSGVNGGILTVLMATSRPVFTDLAR